MVDFTGARELVQKVLEERQTILNQLTVVVAHPILEGRSYNEQLSLDIDACQRLLALMSGDPLPFQEKVKEVEGYAAYAVYQLFFHGNEIPFDAVLKAMEFLQKVLLASYFRPTLPAAE